MIQGRDMDTPDSFPFIVATSVQKRTRAQSRQIKSHAAKAGIPRHRLRKVNPGLPSRRSAGVRQSDLTPRQTHQSTAIATPSPRPELLECPVLGFSVALTPRLLYDVGTFFSELSLKMYPEKLCTEANTEDIHWVGTMFHDQIYFHAIISATEAFFDKPGEVSRLLQSHHHSMMAIQLLQNRVSETNTTGAASDATIMAILVLTFAADIGGDLPTVERHLRGLKRMIDIRGGFEEIQTEVPDLLAKVCRLDLGFALRTWRRPIFFHESISWAPYLVSNYERQVDNHSVDPSLYSWISKLEPRLQILWEDLNVFCLMGNSASRAKKKIPRNTFSEILLSLIYRLLNLTFDLDSAEEMFRLGMLAYTSTMFLQWHNKMIDFYHLRCMLSLTLKNVDKGMAEIPLPVKLWLFFAWHMLQPPEQELQLLDAWFETHLHNPNLSVWPGARQVLQSMAWIDNVNDMEGENIFRRTMLRLVQIG